MKTCYIANCDKSCNFDNTRSMFMLPTAPQVIAKWVAVVPRNRRPLMKGDRICSRHFLESDIERYFEHNINGKLTQMLRDRPKLKNKAFPSQNLNIVLSAKKKLNLKRKADDVSKVSPVKKVKTATKGEVIEEIILSDDPNNLIEYDNLPETEQIYVEVETTEEPEDTMDKAEESESPTQQELEEMKSKNTKRCNVRKVPPKKSDEKKREEFEALYEEVFAVQLPSQLWGIHRCPDMKFMSFSRFDAESLNICDLVVHITDVWQYTVYYKGVKVKQDYLAVMTEDSITVLLDEVDCARYILNDGGQVQVKRKYNKKT